jgi:hypothetical protein
MVAWFGRNSGPPESPEQAPFPPRPMPRKPVVLTNMAPTGGFELRSLTVALSRSPPRSNVRFLEGVDQTRIRQGTVGSHPNRLV